MVATPIGNLADFSLRAIHALALADAVACEDTRVSGGLMRHLGLDKPLMALHEHNEQQGAERVIERLAQGQRVAYVSDAGTPGISDPGVLLATRVLAAGFRVVPVPGCSSVAAALSAAGGSTGMRPGEDLPAGHVFAGFLPSKAQARQAALKLLADENRPVVLFEAPHRIEALAEALAGCCPERSLTVCRELTKQFEQVHALQAQTLPAWLAEDPQRRKGEFVLVLHARVGADTPPEGALPAEAARILQRLLAEDLPLKQTVALAADLSGAPRNSLYSQALAWRQARDAADDSAGGT